MRTMRTAYEIVSCNSSEELTNVPIIFLHGLAECRKSWKIVAPIIVQRTKRKAYLLDARNHGDSSQTKEFKYEVLTRDVIEFMDDFGIKKAIIVGHSMGGRTAINIALYHPDRTEALVVEDMTPENVYSGPETLLGQMFVVGLEILKSIPSDVSLEDGKKSILDALLKFANRKFVDAKRVSENFDLEMVPLKKVGDAFVPIVNVDAVSNMLTSNALVQNLPEKDLSYDGDALFLYGSQPFFKLDKDKSIPKLFPRARIRKIEGSSHLIHTDNPDVFSEVVSDFILNRRFIKSKF